MRRRLVGTRCREELFIDDVDLRSFDETLVLVSRVSTAGGGWLRENDGARLASRAPHAPAPSPRAPADRARAEMAPCLYPFGKPARAPLRARRAEGAGPRDASREGASPRRPPQETRRGSFLRLHSLCLCFAAVPVRAPRGRLGRGHAARRAAGGGSRRERGEGGEERSGGRSPNGSRVRRRRRRRLCRARLLASGAPLRGDPFSPKAQVRAARADNQRARRVFVHDPLSLGVGDVESSSSDESEEEDAAAAAARRLEARGRRVATLERSSRSTGATARRRISTPWVWL